MVDIVEMVALQEVDLRLDDVKRQIDALDDELREPDAHRALADEIAAQQALLDEARQSRKALDTESETLRSKIEIEDGKLYSGEITDAKELRNLQEEIFALRRGLKAIEDRLLARIDEEEHETEAAEYLAKLDSGSRAAWDAHRSQLQTQHDGASAEAAIIIADVDEHRAQLDAADLVVYDAQRQRRRVAVAAAIGGVCGSCHLALPTTILNRARRGAVAVNCSACECIVYIR